MNKPFGINTVYYEQVHGKVPTWNKRADWTFQPPSQYGRKPWMWIDTPYKEATDELEDKASAGGEFYLLP